MAKIKDKEARWINSSNGKALAEHGITCAAFTVEICAKELHDYDIQERIIGGMSSQEAKLYTEEYLVRQGYNRSGHPVWQIRESKIHLLKDWVEHDKGWVGATNTPRLSDLGVTVGRERVDDTIAELYRNEVKKRAVSSGEAGAKLYVSKFIARRGHTEQGNPVWKIHAGAVDLLKQQIKHNPWVNSHERSRLGEYGIVLPALIIDTIVSSYYAELIMTIGLQKQFNRSQAEAYVNESMLRPADSRYGKDSWDIHQSFFTKLLEALPELGPRREENWIPVASSRSLAMGVRAGKLTQEKAAVEFEQKKIQDCVASGMKSNDAKSYVHLHMVKHAMSDMGEKTWKIHAAFMPEFRDFLNALPHRDRYASRTGNGVLGGGRGGNYS